MTETYNTDRGLQHVKRSDVDIDAAPVLGPCNHPAAHSACTAQAPLSSTLTTSPLHVQHCEERPDSWITADQFKAGLAVIHAMPGPMFNFSAYLGAVMAVRAGWNFSVGVAACWLGLFGPGILLLYGLLPFWGKFRENNVYQRALPGLSAAAVGLVVMAVFSMYNSFTCAPLCILLFCPFPFLHLRFATFST